MCACVCVGADKRDDGRSVRVRAKERGWGNHARASIHALTSCTQLHSSFRANIFVVSRSGCTKHHSIRISLIFCQHSTGFCIIRAKTSDLEAAILLQMKDYWILAPLPTFLTIYFVLVSIPMAISPGQRKQSVLKKVQSISTERSTEHLT